MTMLHLTVLKAFSVEEIRSIPPAKAPGCEVILWPAQKRYLFDQSSKEDDDGDRILAPTLPGGACCTGGRWKKEDLGTGGGGGADVDPPDIDPGLTVLQEQDVSGAFGLGGSWAEIPGTEIVFTLLETVNVAFWGMATVGIDFLHRTGGQIGIRLDGSGDFPGTLASSSGLGQYILGASIAHKVMPLLTPSTYRAVLIARGLSNLVNDADYPSSLMVIYGGGGGGVGGASGDNTFTAENKDVVTIKKGQVVAIHSSGVGIVLADGTAAGKEAVGLAVEDIGVGFAGPIQFDGIMDLADWTDATGAATLPARSSWYLDTVAGKIATTPPGTPGNISQVCGSAFSTTKLKIEIDDEAYLL